mgnify:CR=1 FL=1
MMKQLVILVTIDAIFFQLIMGGDTTNDNPQQSTGDNVQ